jgi:hypothetical protein
MNKCTFGEIHMTEILRFWLGGGLGIISLAGTVFSGYMAIKERNGKYIEKSGPNMEKVHCDLSDKENLEGLLGLYVDAYELREENYFEGILTDGNMHYLFEIYKDTFKTARNKLRLNEVLKNSYREDRKIIVQGEINAHDIQNPVLVINYLCGTGKDEKNYEFGKIAEN